jgi:hypothetical protein
MSRSRSSGPVSSYSQHSAFRTTDVVELVAYSGLSQTHHQMRKLYSDAVHKGYRRDLERLRGRPNNLRLCVDRMDYKDNLYLDELIDHWIRTIGVPHPQLKEDWVKFARAWTRYGIQGATLNVWDVRLYKMQNVPSAYIPVDVCVI